ncbi:hypothetical protein SAMN05421847_0456 [Halpernia humi]|uniref:Uncharacterized protein n=1 Tax=Halpernia humi TaxID=493375 RepID=A0A1H5TF94_9FLAO|nr:hypothetical protein [Halpernia humi]SEF61505.1 hypothetical protein SAMN05421847_0456 [Halpernia humi]
MVKEIKNKVIRKDYICTLQMIFCFSILFSTNLFCQHLAKDSIIDKKNNNSSNVTKLGIFVLPGVTVYNGIKEKEEEEKSSITNNLDVSSKKSDSKGIIYVKDISIVYAPQNELFAKVVIIHPEAKRNSLARKTIIEKSTKDDLQDLKNKIKRGIPDRNLLVVYKSDSESSSFNGCNTLKNIGVFSQTFSKVKKFTRVSTEYKYQNIIDTTLKTNVQDSVYFHTITVYENYFTRPPPPLIL